MKQSEHKLQAAFFKWFRLQYPDKYWNCFAIPNGGKRDVKTGAMLKSEGAVSGVWDVLILNNSYEDSSKGLFIEFKTGKNKLTDNQKAFQSANFHYDFVVCYTLEDAVEAVKSYLNG